MVAPEKKKDDRFGFDHELMPDGSFRLPLAKPVDYGDEHVTHLDIRSPSAMDWGDMPVAIQEASYGDMIKLGVKLAGKAHPAFTEKMDGGDGLRLAQLVQGFFIESLGTTGPA